MRLAMKGLMTRKSLKMRKAMLICKACGEGGPNDANTAAPAASGDGIERYHNCKFKSCLSNDTSTNTSQRPRHVAAVLSRAQPCCLLIDQGDYPPGLRPMDLRLARASIVLRPVFGGVP